MGLYINNAAWTNNFQPNYIQANALFELNMLMEERGENTAKLYVFDQSWGSILQISKTVSEKIHLLLRKAIESKKVFTNQRTAVMDRLVIEPYNSNDTLVYIKESFNEIFGYLKNELQVQNILINANELFSRSPYKEEILSMLKETYNCEQITDTPNFVIKSLKH